VHESSYEKMRAFRDKYLLDSTEIFRVLDVGSGSQEQGRSYRELFSSSEFDYTGLDLEAGHNVDLVPRDPFAWAEIPTSSFDVVISGQTYEHNPYFWITTAEIARILRPGGLVAIIAPSKGIVHRFPLDCWRFYPDSWAALCAYVGLELLEGWTEPTRWRMVIPGVYWGDAMMIGRKPQLDDEADSATFYTRLDAIVSTRTALPSVGIQGGKAEEEYIETHTLAPRAMVWHLGYVTRRLNPRLRQRWPLNRIRRRIVDRNGRLAIQRGERRYSNGS
jgi:SAM-dependent methyltransferase